MENENQLDSWLTRVYLEYGAVKKCVFVIL